MMTTPSESYLGPIIAVVGPTATGKSALALDLCEALGGEVVNADAMQLYRGMDIGTAKLPLAERRGIDHHLLDILDITAEASVAAYQGQARAVIGAIRQRGRVPVLVGGSGLYVRAALDPLVIPPTDPQVRSRYEEQADSEGVDALYAVLRQRDPVAAEAIDPRNARRIVRALEVIEITGRPFSASMPTRTYLSPTVAIGLDADTAVIDERIDARVRAMWADGLIDEVRQLEPLGLRTGRTASRAIGYAQALAQLDGELSEDAAIAATQQLTRRFARRQRSWFRPDPRITWFDAGEPAASAVDHVLAAVRDTGARD